MKKKKVLAGFLLGLGVLGSTACSFGEEAMDAAEEKEVTVVKSDTEVQSEQNIGYKVYEGSIRKMEDMAKPELYFPAGSDYKQLPDGVEGEKSWEDTEGNYLLVEPGGVSYGTPKSVITYDDFLYDEKGEFRNNFHEILDEGSVEGISQEEALEKIEKIVEENALSVKNIVAHPLTKENLTKLSRLFMSDEEYEEYVKDNEPLKREFAEEDEAYLVIMNLCVGKHVLYSKDYEYGARYYPESFAWAIVSKEGIEEFKANGIYDVDMESVREIDVLSLEEAQECLNEKFEGILSSKMVECKEISEAYLAVSDGEQEGVSMIPVYTFVVVEQYTESKGEEELDVSEEVTLILDRETGNWIE